MTTAENPRAQAAAGSTIQVFARLAFLLITMVLIGYLTRRLGTAEYGRYAVSLVLINWLAITIGVATGGATVRLVAGRANGPRYAVTMLQMVGLLAFVIAFLIFTGAEPLANLLRSPAIAPMIQVLSLDFAIGSIGELYTSILVAQRRYLQSALTALTSISAQLLATVLFVEQGFLAMGACWGVVLGSIVQLMMGRVTSGIAFFSHDRVPFGDLWGHNSPCVSPKVWTYWR